MEVPASDAPSHIVGRSAWRRLCIQLRTPQIESSRDRPREVSRYLVGRCRRMDVEPYCRGMASEWVTSIVSTATLVVGAGITYLTQAGSDRRKVKAEAAARKEEADRAERMEREKALASERLERQRFQLKSVRRMQRAASSLINESASCYAHNASRPTPELIGRQARAASEFIAAVSLVAGGDRLNELQVATERLSSWSRRESSETGSTFERDLERFHEHVATVSREILDL